MEARPALAPALILGIGLGGFIDGIVLHQILQWHHLLTATAGHPSTTVAGLEVNTFADGLLHAGSWVIVFIGTAAMVRAWQQRRIAPPWRAHVGMLLLGWGVFNLVEGVIDHQILEIHHVRDDLGGPQSWDLGFFAFGVLLVAVGYGMRRSAQRPASR